MFLRVMILASTLTACASSAPCPPQLPGADTATCETKLRACGADVGATTRVIALRSPAKRLVLVDRDVEIGIDAELARGWLERLPEDLPSRKLIGLINAASADVVIDDPQGVADASYRLDDIVWQAILAGRFSLRVHGVASERIVLREGVTAKVFSDRCVPVHEHSEVYY
jgi:hypothetical protein